MSAPRTTTTRLPAEDRRRQLLESALDLFAKRGFEGTTTREIAAAAGVNEAIIFRHFPTKHDLYSAVIDYKHEPGVIAAVVSHWQTFMDAGDDRGLFRALVNKVIDGYRTDARMNRVLLFAALEGHQAGLEQHRQRSLPLYERLCQYVARRQSEGAIRPGNPAAIILAVVGTAAYFAQMTELFGFCSDLSDSQIIEDFLETLMNGIKASA